MATPATINNPIETQSKADILFSFIYQTVLVPEKKNKIIVGY
jgi:hypothetical protein